MDSEPVLRSPQGELVLLIANQARRIPTQRYLTSILMGLLLMLYVPAALSLAWMLAVYWLVMLRTQMIMKLEADATRSDVDKLRRMTGLYALTGVAQVAVVAFFPLVPVLIQAVITIYLVGVCSATLQATAGYRPICLPYTLIMMVPLAIAWGVTPGDETGHLERLIFAALTLVYITALLGHAKGLYAVFLESYDIRMQRVELNNRLREALANAESANQAKTRFLASASHDLRQPIHALSLFSGSLQMRPMDGRTAAIARQIDLAVKSLGSQLDALLDISRLDAGVIERSISTVDLCGLVAQLADEFRPQAEGKGLRLRARCETGMYVRTDPTLMQRILRNLLSNAIKYTDHGHVEIVVERVGAHYRVRVTDTGQGIPASEHQHIFEEFYQLQNPERDRSKGLGLGLAIVRRLTQMLDIEIKLDSAPGRGSSFWADLPAVRSETSPFPEAPEATDPASPGVKILVVDDEEAIRVGMKTLLEEMGFAVQAVASTDAAIDASRLFQPSVVLADWRLRGDDSGLHTIKALRMVWPQLPALLISGDTAPDRLREARTAGVELLHKPVDALQLRDSILKAVQA
ncbi:hybrid sensor histidine kinase/response regulator [Fontimonas sp. SYSU GA230001]|uniref:ATP-binding response regulator n=1 Tax=Fontimonas sp. SYSU GA230001 TaxID=3142450 RepID=UPI0032B3AA07